MPTNLPVVDNARFEDIARRLVRGDSVKDIAAAHDISTRQAARLLRDPRCEDIYRRVSDEVYRGDPEADLPGVDQLLRDEKAAVSERQQALAQRAQTVLAELLEAVKDRATDPDKTLTVGWIDAGTKAVRAAMDYRDENTGPGTVHQHLHLQLTQPQRSVIETTASECGVDLSDLDDGGDTADDAAPEATDAED